MISRNIIMTRVISYQLIGYGVLLFLVIGNEVFDIPHNVFGAPATRINMIEALIEGMYIVALGAFSMYLSLNFLKKIKFLEGFLPICAHCKKIRQEKDWVSLEKYMCDHSEAVLSHGVCPDCAEKYYGEYLKRDKDKTENKSAGSNS